MPTCPECENDLDVELDEVEEGDVVACEECGTEYEIVGSSRWNCRVWATSLMTTMTKALKKKREEE